MKVQKLLSGLLLAVFLSTNGQVVSLVEQGNGSLLEPTHRDQLTFEELMLEEYPEDSPIDNRYFLPVGESGSALHEIQGVLTVPKILMEMSTSKYPSYRFFPGFSVEFFTFENYLVPAIRTLIVSPENWSLILSPGKIWSEPGDNGMSRASFPFTLGSPPGRSTAAGEAHNGVATFLFDDTHVSSIRFQVTQEIAPDGDIFDMWGQTPMEYLPGAIANQEMLAIQFADELARQMPIRSLADLQTLYDSEVLDTLTEGIPLEEISAAGIVIDGVIYLLPGLTRFGEYPYLRYMQHGVMSISKSIGAGIAMLWLAQKYGEGVFDLKIVDYLDVTADHDGWNAVTFGDVLDMATGVGDNAPNLRPFEPYANETGVNYRNWYFADSTEAKLSFVFASDDYPWGPGEIMRYTSSQTFVLSAAMDAFIKSQEGPDAHLWDMLMEEVFQPIGIYHITMIHVPNGPGNPGIPLMSSGLRVTVDDIGKIVSLLQNGGQYGGQQLLNKDKLAEALYRTGKGAGLPSGKTFSYGDQAYLMSFWSIPHKTQDDRYFQVPFMSGAGGNTIFIAPNGVSTFVFTDHGVDTYSLNCPAIAESIRPYPAGEIRFGMMQIGKGVWIVPENLQRIQTINYLFLMWFVLTLGSLGFIIFYRVLSISASLPTKLIWIASALFFGPFSIVAHLLTRKYHKQG